MSTNATTWFYAEPEKGRPYLIGERLTHTFWANRLSSIYLTCVQAEPPYKVVGDWRDIKVAMEWEPKHFFRLLTSREDHGLITVTAEVLGFRPTVSYRNADGQHVTEWYLDKSKAKARLQELQGNPAYTQIQKYR
jgi:hypothetical protein